MINKIDKSEFRFIYVAFIQKTNLRQPLAADADGKDSLRHLQNIIESDKPIIKTLVLEHDAVRSEHTSATGLISNSKNILEYHFVWGRMILEFYYFYHDTKEDTQKIVDKMIAFEDYVYINEAVQKGLKLIDDYYQNESNEPIPETPRAQNSPCVDTQETSLQQPELVQAPDILQLMQDINSGKIRHDEVDWEYQLKTLLFMCQLMPRKFPDVILVWGILSVLDDPAIKMDIIDKLRNAAPKCFDNLLKVNDFINDCTCIYKVCQKAREYNQRQDIAVSHIWSGDRKDLNDLAHVFSDEMVDAKWMVGMIEEMKRTEVDNRKHPMMEIILRANRNVGRLSIDNIVDFAKRLYIAEGFRQLILSGEKDYRDMPTLEKFYWRIRNACFDVYIDLRKERIKEFLNRDNARVDEADDFEALQYMLKEEESVVARENGLEAFKGSYAYDAMWYPGRKLILEMIDIFIQYLQKKIEEMRKAEMTQQGGLHIDHLDNFAMGDIVQTKIVKEHD